MGKRQNAQWIAEPYDVITSTVKWFLSRYRQIGSVAPSVQSRKKPLMGEVDRSGIEAMVARALSLTLAQHCEQWPHQSGMRASIQTMSRVLQRFGLVRKKTVGAHERDEVGRQDWCAVAETPPARRIIGLDESSPHLDIVSRYARAPRGQRAFVRQRRNCGKNITLLAGLTLEGSVTSEAFMAFVEHILLPTLNQGDSVILDNLALHKVRRVKHLLRSKGCQLRFLPAYSPDLSPIENAFGKVKQYLRSVRAQTVETFIEAIEQTLNAITPYDTIGFFAHAGFLNLD